MAHIRFSVGEFLVFPCFTGSGCLELVHMPFVLDDDSFKWDRWDFDLFHSCIPCRLGDALKESNSG